jgi:prepilin-type N-terminal cleavage/methylation domain-containing protein
MMKRNDESLAGVSSRHSRSAFTLMELLVVIGVMAMLASLQLAALTNNRTQGQVMTCRYNLGQLTRAWQMYAEDNAGWFPPNGDFSSSFGRGWIRGALSMNANNPDNTNQINLTDGKRAVLAPYAGRSASLYRCPADASVAREGPNLIPRVRSISMNGAVGTKSDSKAAVDGPWLTGSHGVNTHAAGPYRTYGKSTDITAPRPEDLFVLIDEDEYSINDGVFAMSMATRPLPTGMWRRIRGSIRARKWSMAMSTGCL